MILGMARRARHDTKDDKFDKVENIKTFQTLKIGAFVKFEGVDAKVDRQNERKRGRRDASLHQIKLRDEGPVYQVISCFNISNKGSYNFFISLTI